MKKALLSFGALTVTVMATSFAAPPAQADVEWVPIYSYCFLHPWSGDPACHQAFHKPGWSW